MDIAKKIGLSDSQFCRMAVNVKMFLSNILGHAAERHYEKILETKGIIFIKAPTDTHYDYLVENKRCQVKRFESSSTNSNFIGVNLTKTHGDRSGADAFYKDTDFDKLILFDVGLLNYLDIDIKDIPKHPKYPKRLISHYKIKRATKLEGFDLDFLYTMKIKNQEFQNGIKSLKEKYNLNDTSLLERCCNLSLNEIDSLFSQENFRLIVGAKGFGAEERLKILLEKNNIQYKQNNDMYSKIDFWINHKRVQVKIPNERANTETHWGVKLHKSHGHGLGELCPADAFDILALFVGDEKENNFIFVPMSNLDKYPANPKFLKRIAKIPKNKYKINDLSIFR